MVQRCTNPNNPRYARYGGRGIKVCDRWRDAASFIEDNIADYRPGLTLDRIDNDGDYEPGNVRWVDYKTQSRNTSLTHHITYDGKTMCVSDWAAHLGINKSTLANRLNRHGWDPIKALTTPVGRWPSQRR